MVADLFTHTPNVCVDRGSEIGIFAAVRIHTEGLPYAVTRYAVKENRLHFQLHFVPLLFPLTESVYDDSVQPFIRCAVLFHIREGSAFSGTQDDVLVVVADEFAGYGKEQSVLLFLISVCCALRHDYHSF